MVTNSLSPCPVCGCTKDELHHHCSPRCLAKKEARYRREEEDELDEELTFEDRLDAGFAMLSEFPAVCP